MSQPRMRKAPVIVGGNGSRVSASVAKASGDTVACNIALKQQNRRSSTKNKIPKSIRYDLENALVSLCDLWFEDIKPHLIRNNIKLHVHGGGGAGGGGAGPASGDYGRVPPGAPGCSHLDPGAASDVRALLRLVLHQRRRSSVSCADCCSTVRTASKVRCPKPRTRHCLSPPAEVPPPSLHIPLPHATSNQSNNGGYNGKKKPLSRRRGQQPHSSPSQHINWRVPRLCRTSSILPPTCPSKVRMRRGHTALKPQNKLHVPQGGDFFQLVQSKHRVKMKHKSTQTETCSRLSRPAVPSRPTPPMPFGRCPGTTTIPHRHRNPEGNCRRSRSKSKPLFSKDLINIIAEKHDKKIRLLYRSPQREVCPSVMNLIQASDDQSKESASVGKKKPWR